MKTEEEIKKRIQRCQSNQWAQRKKDDDAGIRAWAKAEKILRWVLED